MQTVEAILITGPTASGKSRLAIDLALSHGGVVVNADSMQVYDVLSLLTARPDAADLAAVEHRLYGHVAPSLSYSTGAWLRDMAELLAELKRNGRLPVIVGGTGLYFKALTEGLSDLPLIPAEVRERLRQRLAAEGPEILHEELARLDPPTADRLAARDGQRILRALEVITVTGEPFGAVLARKGQPLLDPQRCRKIVLAPDRDLLHQRINRRFETMFADGALEEVQALLALDLDPSLPAMKAIGVPEIAAYLAGTLSERAVIERAQAATRQYAKRQMTWFRNQMDDSWERRVP